MFEGTYTAIVTPFRKNGSVDYGKIRELVELQVEAGIDGIVPVGTTGESPTLDMKEHCRVVDAYIRAVDGRIKVVAGTGANATSEAIELTRHARRAGADGTLQVTPYYNKPSQEGLYRHFSIVADLGLPVMLYNIPGRTGREIAVETVVRLAKHPNIVCLKEAGGSVDRVKIILRKCDITVVSGDDPLTVPMVEVGAKGVVSVASNIVPETVARMVRLALHGRWKEARKLHSQYLRLFKDMFIDTNPIPVKTAMAMMGLIEEVFRLPLCQMSKSLKVKLRKTLVSAGVL